MSTNVTALSNISPERAADELGILRAKIASLREEQKNIEAYLKACGIDEVNGLEYRVTISYAVQRTTIDWKAIAAKLQPSRQLITAHTRMSEHDRVNVSALRK